MSGIKEGLHATPLTQGEWNQLFHGDEWERHPTHCVTLVEVARIRATIDNGGFAPAEPTDEQIAETIARAMGWKRHKHSLDHTPVWWAKGSWESRPETFVTVEAWQPATNLTQAAQALQGVQGIPTDDIIVNLTDGGAHVEWDHESGGRFGTGNVTQEDAARRLSLLLYERITNASGEDEVERARRFV